MPGIDGLDFIEKLKHDCNTSGLTVIGVSANTTEKDRMSKFIDLCDGFLSKPLAIEMLFEKMRVLLDIEWQFNKVDALPTADSLILEFPSPAVLDQIVNYCEIGNYTLIAKILSELATDPSYMCFCKQINKYLNVYDFDGIIAFIHQYH